MYSNLSHTSNDGLRASYNLSLMLARKGKPHTIGEALILPSVKEVLDTILHHKASSTVIKSIPLSNNTVQRRVDEKATDIEDSLCSIIRNTELSLQLDESLLLGYVRFVNDEVLHEEFAIALTLDSDPRAFGGQEYQWSS
ncbi:SCAN domain-containing protein 3-like [Clavelina lepadiformis]|uniref:SCAN domain-containing protein 3-like n=1 Tax=Clavelina lepadiformis TaxID=159417 RepID=UPI004040EE01